jgi:Fe-S cluster assembly protein SufD
MLEALSTALPDQAHAQRAASLSGFTYPTPAMESWHYSDWSSLGALSFAVAGSSSAPAFEWDAVLPLQAQALPFDVNATGFALERLNASFATQGVVQTLHGDNFLPLLITHGSPGANAMQHWRHHITLAADSAATLIVWDAPGTDLGEAPSLLTALLRLELHSGSKLTLIRIQDADAAATRALRVEATVAAGATLNVMGLDFGGRRVRHELHARLTAANAQINVKGLNTLGGKSHVDGQVWITHAAPHCTSRSDTRLLAAGKSRAILNAKVFVLPGAVKTDSETKIASLLLSTTAEIDAKPELEIYADDVKCAHGASYGQLDEDALFYLRARGLDAATAQGLLTLAFAQSITDQIPLPGLKAWAESRVQSVLTAQAP